MEDETDIKIIVSDDEEYVAEVNEVEEEASEECSCDVVDDQDEEEAVEDEHDNNNDDDDSTVDPSKPLEVVDDLDLEYQQPLSDLTLDVAIDDDDDDVIDVDLEEGEGEASTDEEEDEETMVVSTAIEQHNNNKKQCKWKRRRTRLRQFFLSRRRRHGQGGASYVRMGAVSWWTECKNIETSGCTFVLGYIVASFVLMSLMFNMREIVGDYCLGSKELKREEYLENLEKAMELHRRRSSPEEDENNRFEKELTANLYYDKQGQISADDLEYFQNHRVPIIHYYSDSTSEDFQDEFDP